MVHTVLATVFWPYFAISRVRHHFESMMRKMTRATGIDPISNRGPDRIWFRELGFKMTAAERDVVNGYFELTHTLHEPPAADAFTSAELFEIAGHSNPRAGARCIARSRRVHLARKQTMAASYFVHLLNRKMLEGSTISLPLVGSFCLEMKDDRTALQVELLGQKKLKLGESTVNIKSKERGQDARVI
jgi:hypothetical protein